MPIITNIGSNTMEKTLTEILPKTDKVDILTAYFYFSGFSRIAKMLKDKHIRILVGKTIEPEAADELANAVKNNPNTNLGPYESRNQNLTRLKRREYFTDSFVKLFNCSALTEAFDSTEGQEAFKIFEEKLLDGSLEIRMTEGPEHGKQYILTNDQENAQKEKSKGTVLVGSSNFTFSGLLGQGELNNKLTDNQSYDEHMSYFEKLWENGIDIKTKNSNNDFMQIIKEKLWIHATPDPYKIYIRILHELYSNIEGSGLKTPDEISGGKFSNLKYQLDAISQGINCLEKYNGVIVADVVGLGKSIIASAIANNIDIPRTIIITPPHLKQQWEDYILDFGIRGAYVESGGKLKELHERFANSDFPTLYIIDEAHRYRNELTDDYQYLHQLTRSNAENKVILLTATPYNNKPQDLFALIKLFQTPSRSTINSVDNLSLRFRDLIIEYRKLERQGKKNRTKEVEEKLQEIGQQIRMLINPVVIRRSRLDLKRIKEYADDLKNQNISFPEVIGPKLVQYDLGNIKDLYLSTLVKITDSENGFSGARYRSASYIEDSKSFLEKYGRFFDESDLVTAQTNLAQFMRRLLVMRFESSKYAFQSTLNKMIHSHETILKWWYSQSLVPIQKKGDILDPEDLEDFDDIDDMLEKIEVGEDFERKSNEAIYVPSHYFKRDFILEVENDLELLKTIRIEWFANNETGEDPKQEKVEFEIARLLREYPERKIVIFSSYADTATWVAKNLRAHGFERTFLYTGGSTKEDKRIASENFDASYRNQKNDYDIIVATDALSEGFNLHRAGVIINYDIPYNPTRVVQRIGRINRINKKVFDKIYIYNFFPTDIGDNITNTKGISTLKMLLINKIVGSDTKTLTPDETLESYFKRQFAEADTESGELSWDVDYINDYNMIKHDQNLIREVMKIPEHTRIVRKFQSENISIAFAKRGNNSLFALSDDAINEARILNPEFVLKYFKANQNEKSFEGDEKLDERFKILYDKITEKYPVPKIDGRRQEALKNVEFLAETSQAEKDYLLDLKDIILEYDDLSDGELKFIAQLQFKNGIEEPIKQLKEKFSIHYINEIKNKAETVSSLAELVMFTEDLRQK